MFSPLGLLRFATLLHSDIVAAVVADDVPRMRELLGVCEEYDLSPDFAEEYRCAVKARLERLQGAVIALLPPGALSDIYCRVEPLGAERAAAVRAAYEATYFFERAYCTERWGVAEYVHTHVSYDLSYVVFKYCGGSDPDRLRQAQAAADRIAALPAPAP